MVTYPQQAQELIALLKADQDEKREAGRAYFYASDKKLLAAKRAKLKQKTQKRTARMRQILAEIEEPSISNIGVGAAQAVSVLALHDSLDVLRRVLKIFDDLYERDKNNAYYQAIPSMTDRVLILERKPQRFGTQWLFDAAKQPIRD